MATYKEINDTIKSMEQTIDSWEMFADNMLEEEGFNIPRTKEFMISVTEDDIKFIDKIETAEEIFKQIGDFTDESIEKLARTTWVDEQVKKDRTLINMQMEAEKNELQDGKEKRPSKEVLDKIEKYRTKLQKKFKEEFSDVYTSKKLECIKAKLLDVLKLVHNIENSKKQEQKFKEETKENMAEYIAKITSEEYLEKKRTSLKELEEKANALTNEKEKAIILKQVEEQRAADNFTFLFTRFNALGTEETDRIVRNFFSTQRSRATIQRCTAKLKQLGYQNNIWQAFFNLEENFLEEKYHVFNNLFLFQIMSFVAYIEPSKEADKLFAGTLISYTGNLIYGRFSSDVERNRFVKVITDYLDLYEPYREKFEKDNAMAPSHPTRVARMKEEEESVREMIYANLADAGYKVTEAVKKLDLPDLRDFYDEWINKYLAEKNSVVKTPLGDIITELRLNTEGHMREKLKKTYMQFAGWTEEMNQFFNTEDIEILKKTCKEAQDACSVRQKKMDAEAKAISKPEKDPEDGVQNEESAEVSNEEPLDTNEED